MLDSLRVVLFTDSISSYFTSQELLKALALDQKSVEEVASIKNSINLSAVAVVAFDTLARWRETMPNFESSAMLVELIDKILGLVPPNPETSIKASMLAKDVLLRQWPVSNIIKVSKPFRSPFKYRLK